MEGCARRERRRFGHTIAIGWHAENFSRAGKSLKNLDFYLRQLEPAESNPADDAAVIFAGFADRGLVKIREVPRED